MRRLWLVAVMGLMVSGGLLLAQEERAPVAKEKARARRARKAQLSPEERKARSERYLKQNETQLARMQKMGERIDARYGRLESPEAEALVTKLKDLYEQASAAMAEQIDLARQDKRQEAFAIRAKVNSFQTTMRQVESLLNLYSEKERNARIAEDHADNPDIVAAADKIVQLCAQLIELQTQILKLTEDKAPIVEELSQATQDLRSKGYRAARRGRLGQDKARARKGKSRKGRKRGPDREGTDAKQGAE